jgi:hypothetical protein
LSYEHWACISGCQEKVNAANEIMALQNVIQETDTDFIEFLESNAPI